MNETMKKRKVKLQWTQHTLFEEKQMGVCFPEKVSEFLNACIFFAF